jgi:ABC-type thiamine transport system substrate-binding protein
MIDEPIRPKFGAPSLRAKDNAGFSCRHRNVSVCRQSRTVECDLCGTVLDPIQVLLDFAYLERTLVYNESKIKNAHKVLEELKKEERNLKARIARIKRNKTNDPR